MKKIIDQIYQVNLLRIGHVYAIVGDAGVTLIDTSIRGVANRMDRELASIGKRLRDVRHILITHAHPDHIGSAAQIKQRSGAQIWIGARDAAVARGHEPIPRPKPQDLQGISRWIGGLIPDVKQPPVEVDRELHEGDVLDEILPGLTVVETPGHSYGHISFYYPARKLLFVGDAIMHLLGLSVPIPFFTTDMAEAKRSIAKIAGMELDILCFGHGAPLMSKAGEAVRAFAKQKGIPA